MRRHAGPKPPTRFINLDRMPTDDGEVADFHLCLLDCEEGLIANGWGEVSYWPSEQLEAGDWTPAVWRSPELARTVTNYTTYMSGLHRLPDLPNLSINLTSPQLIMNFQSSKPIAPGCIPILKSRGADGQRTIRSAPDDYRIPKNADQQMRRLKGDIYPQTKKISNKAGYLLVTDGQRSNTARVTAVAGDSKYVG